jgi:hypothetical protein
MRPRFCSIFAVVALLLIPAISAAAQKAPSLETFLASLPASPSEGGVPVSPPEPQWAATCSEILQACLAGCAGNPSCELLCRCDYYECRGWEIPNYCS